MFKEVTSIDADTTTALGGINKKTNKPNPKSIEGYYLGKKVVESKKARSGYCNIFIFQTAKGSVGVWGKTDLDRKMAVVNPGVMVRVTHSGMQPTPNGDMYKYKVEIDENNTTEIVGAVADSSDDTSNEDTDNDYNSTDDSTEDYSASDADAEEAEQQAALEAAERAAKAKKVQDLLKKKGATTAKTN
jgi:hypothetical protein